MKFTATVSATSGTPTGSVTFKDGATVLGTTALAGGVANFSTAKLASGNHSITASFVGSTYFVASASGALTEVVENGTTTVVTSSANPSVFGQSVTLTATISHGTIIPTGTVTFKAGATILTTATVGSSGTATYTSSAFTVGDASDHRRVQRRFELRRQHFACVLTGGGEGRYENLVSILGESICVR